MKFWDSSAVVALLVDEAASEQLTPLFHADPAVVAWWGTDVECESAFSRRERLGQLPSQSAGRASRRLRTLFQSWHVVDPGALVKESAMRLLRVHSLRAGDALQLAAAMAASTDRASLLDFVCLDDRLAQAARREGFNVIGI